MQTSSILNLRLPEANDHVQVEDFNYNFRELDRLVGAVPPRANEYQDGYLTKDDYSKLKTIETGANKFVLPEAINCKTVTASVRVVSPDIQTDSIVISNSLKIPGGYIWIS